MRATDQEQAANWRTAPAAATQTRLSIPIRSRVGASAWQSARLSYKQPRVSGMMPRSDHGPRHYWRVGTRGPSTHGPDGRASSAYGRTAQTVVATAHTVPPRTFWPAPTSLFMMPPATLIRVPPGKYCVAIKNGRTSRLGKTSFRKVAPSVYCAHTVPPAAGPAHSTV